MKIFYNLFFGLYLIVLLWLVLFKSSFEILSVFADYQTRSLNLIPFAHANVSEMLSNIIVFIPFGLLLSVNFKLVSFRHKLAAIFVFSLITELIQFIFAIGSTDVTDVMMNVFGGSLGLKLYELGNKYIVAEKLDRGIVAAGVILFVLFMYFRIFVFKVRY